MAANFVSKMGVVSSKATANRIARLKEARKKKEMEELKTFIGQLESEKCKEMLVAANEKRPGLIFDIAENITHDSTTATQAPSFPDWCKCNHCREMPTVAEKVCCGLQSDSCISLRPELAHICLVLDVLDVAITLKTDILCNDGDEDRIKEYRHTAYRQFSCWRNNNLTSEFSRVMPSCCIWRIRDEFPDQCNQYSGFNPDRII